MKANEYSNLDKYASVKLDGDKPSAAQHFIMFYDNGVCAMFEYRPHVAKSVGKRGKKSGEPFDLKAYLASLSPEERAALLQSVAE